MRQGLENTSTAVETATGSPHGMMDSDSFQIVRRDPLRRRTAFLHRGERLRVDPTVTESHRLHGPETKSNATASAVVVFAKSYRG